MDWRNIADEKEKYAAYLCSREWSEKRELVKHRANGQCERCGDRPIDSVHHLTYVRKYDEELEDLQGLCTPCHEFIHAKRDDDPKSGGWQMSRISIGTEGPAAVLRCSCGSPEIKAYPSRNSKQGSFLVSEFSCSCQNCGRAFLFLVWISIDGTGLTLFSASRD